MADLWTVERTETLRRRWDEGASAGTIAGELHLTRNAVVGKVHRLRLSGRVTITRRAPVQTTPPARRSVERRFSGVERTDVVTERAPRPPRTPKAAPDFAANPVTFAELQPRHCRWPIGHPGTPDFRFCGGDKVEGSSYCAGHCRLAYTTPAEREGSRAAWLAERARRAAA